MITLELLLSIVNQSLTWANNTYAALPVEQQRAFAERQEARLEIVWNLVHAHPKMAGVSVPSAAAT
jgi:hypothetical protein